MALCTANLTLSAAQLDNPMDGAIYHSTRNSFFAVRGGYISEYSTALTLVSGPAKFASSIFGRSCVAYDSVNDRIWVGTNGDHAAGYLGDTGGFPGAPAKSTVGLYRIVPSTLSTEAFIDPTTIIGVSNYGCQTGVFDVLVANSKLFSTFWSSIGTTASMKAWAFALNLPAYTVSWSGQTGLGAGNSQMAHDSANKLWVNSDDDNYNSLPVVFGADTGTPLGGISQPPNGAHPAICFTGSAIYMVDMTNQALVKLNFTTGALISTPVLTGSTIGGMTSRIRFNSTDGFIYIPCPASNQMIIYNPGSDSVSSIVTSGIDSPHDVVFGGGVRVAIQQGSAGLKLF